MRINYKYGIRTLSGKIDDLVHMACNKGRVAIGRVFVMPTLVAQHLLFGNIGRNLAVLWADCSEAFKEDLKIYTAERIPYYTAEQVPAYANYAFFVKFLWAFSDTVEIDLAEATLESLELAGCPDNIAGAVDEELLPIIPDASELTNEW